MGRPPKVDYKLLEKEYVTGDMSLRDLAKEHELSWSTVAAQARREDITGKTWTDKRSEFRGDVAEKAMARTKQRFAVEEADIRDELVNINRATLAVYAQQLKDGKVQVSPRDAVNATTALLNLLGQPTARTETTIVDGTTGFDPAQLRRLLEIARARIVDGSVADAPGPDAPGTRPN